MGVYNNVVISTGLEDRVNSLVNYLNSLSAITAEAASETYDEVEFTGALFYLDNVNIHGFFGYDSTLKLTFIWLINGESYLIPKEIRGSTFQTAGVLTIHSYIGDGCVLISMYDSHSTNDGIEFMLVNINDSVSLIGYKRLTSAAFLDIDSLYFENVADVSRIQYTYANMFPYYATAGTLDFLAQAYFINNNIRRFTTSVLKECSTVSLLSTVSLPAPLGNHLAIGAHCIVPITEGGE